MYLTLTSGPRVPRGCWSSSLRWRG